jgi:Family of unknown function (DUF5989)
MKDLENPKKTVRHCPHCGNIEGSAILANREVSILMPQEAEVIGLWTFMKERKKFWLLPMIMVGLLLGSLAVMDTDGRVPIEMMCQC